MSAIEERIQADIKAAMKGRRKDELLVLRTVMADAKNAAIADGGERSGLSDEQMLRVLRKGIKTRRDSIEAYQEGGREDLVATERAQIEIVRRYLPTELPEQELETIVDAVVAETGASSRRDMGRVMGEVMARVAGRADGKQVSRLVAARLS